MDPCLACQRLSEQLAEQTKRFEDLCAEHDVLKISTQDAASTHETVVRELRRQLEREMRCVNALDVKALAGCPACAANERQCRIVRESNAQEYRWVTRFAKLSTDLQLELKEALSREKLRYAQLRAQHDELVRQKADPFNRDAEIQRLKAEAQEAKRQQANANATALMANKVTEAMQRELAMAQDRVESHDKTLRDAQTQIKTLEEIIHTHERAEELQSVRPAVGQCEDWMCRRRAIDAVARQKALAVEIQDLQHDRNVCLALNRQLQHELDSWKALGHGPEAGKKKAKRSLVVVQDLASSELCLNLRSLFTIFPGWSEEDYDENEMLADFIRDMHPDAREAGLRSVLAMCGAKEEQGEVQMIGAFS